MNVRASARRAVPLWVAACLLAAISDPALANPGSQRDPDAAEAIRREVEAFREKDLLRVRLHDTSERLGCLKGTESDGLFIGPPEGAGQKLLYGDIAAVARQERPNFLRRVVIPVAALTGVVFGAAKIGSNTPKTVVLKVYLGSGAGVIVGEALRPRVPPCR